MTPVDQGADRWAVRLPGEDAAEFVVLRHRSDITVARQAEWVWFQGRFDVPNDCQTNQSLQHFLGGLLNADRYYLLADDQLIPFGKRVPADQLPHLDWAPLSRAIALQLPIAGLPGSPWLPIGVKLVQGASRFHGPNARPQLMTCRLEDFARWTGQAAKIRLDRLQFACSADGTVVVKGDPLPPIVGQHFSLVGSVAIPLGWHWRPVVSARTLNETFHLPQGALAVWFEDNRWWEIADSELLPVSRSAVRASAAKLRV